MLPCDLRRVKIEVFDITEEREKILTVGEGMSYYLSYVFHRERVYEVVWAEKGFKQRISWEAQPVRSRKSAFRFPLFIAFLGSVSISGL